MSLSSLLLPLLLAVADDSVKTSKVPPPHESAARNSDDLRSSLCQRPSLVPVIDVVKRIPVGESIELEGILSVKYEADGTVTSVSMYKETGVPEVDAALMAWARQARLCPVGSAGHGRLPFLIVPE